MGLVLAPLPRALEQLGVGNVSVQVFPHVLERAFKLSTALAFT